jgi:hypothetical protein
MASPSPSKSFVKGYPPPPKILTRTFWGKNGIFEENFDFFDRHFPENIWELFGFSQICTKILTPPPKNFP